MGSLEAYLAAAIFALVGPSSWALRTEPIIVSLAIIALTWRLASVIVKRTSLPIYAQRCFIWSSTLVAACIPLYDLIIELHTWGAWIEVFVVMLWLLLSAFRLVVCWQDGATLKELAWRWAGLGFLMGLGLWLYPLVTVAIIACTLWIAAGFLMLIFRDRKQKAASYGTLFLVHGRGLLLAVVALPAALISAAPAICWGANNHWANVTYILQLDAGKLSLRQRLHFYENLVSLYQSCVGPRVIGGSITFESGLLHSIHTFTFYATVFCMATCVLLYLASFVLHNDLLIQLRRIVALPLLFGLLTIVIFCVSSASGNGIGLSCSNDFAGRYASGIALALPFFLATVLTAAVSFLRGYGNTHKEEPLQLSRPYRFVSRISTIGQILAIALFLAYIGANILTYRLSDPGYTLQSPYCVVAPANNDPIIEYLKQEHIQYAWAPPSLAYPITFKTNSAIIVMDSEGALKHIDWLNRIPAHFDKVSAADRPSLLEYVVSSTTHPVLLRLLDKQHITYKYARFPSEPGVDVIVVTPLNQSVPLSTAPDIAQRVVSCSVDRG